MSGDRFIARGKYDYDALEQEFITTDLSVRALAEKHGISAWSAVNAQAIKRKWREKREEFRAQASSKTIAKQAETVANKVAQIRVDALDVIHAAVFKMAQDMRDRVLPDGTVVPGITVTPSDLAKLIDKMLLLTGQPTAIGENRNLGLNFTADGLPPEVLRELEAITRPAVTRTAGRAALPGSRSPGPN